VIETRSFHDGSGSLGSQGTEASERVVFFARKTENAVQDSTSG
jgi:hypothetical protein